MSKATSSKARFSGGLLEEWILTLALAAAVMAAVASAAVSLSGF